MSGGKNQRALLMELLVVVLFFGLCATVLLQTFMAARETSRRAGLQSEALTEMQVLSEGLYAAQDVEDCLAAAGFTLDDANDWVRQEDGYILKASPEQQKTDAGSLRDVVLVAVMQDETLAQWHCVRYLPGEVGE